MNGKVSALAVFCFVSFLSSGSILAATTPPLGAAATYGILSSTYTNTVPGTTVSGDIGFTTPPAVVPSGAHANYGSGAPYSTAGTDQGVALANLNAQACTHTFPNGAVDLATDTSHGTIGMYAPGVYCTTASSAASIGTAGITLSGAGTYIFRINGALTSVMNSHVTLANGASTCDVFWTPTEATTLGANSTFRGTNIDASGITLGVNVAFIGRALAFGGTVTTDVDDNIYTPTCSVPVPPTPPTPPAQSPDLLRVVKTVINDNGGTAVASDFNVHVKLSGTDVAGSPAVGISLPGREYWLLGNTYVVSEDYHAGYTATFSGDCDVNGVVAVGLAPKTCTITNNDNATTPPPYQSSGVLHIIKHVVNSNGGTATASSFTLRVNNTGSFGTGDVTGSPRLGAETPGTSYTLPAGVYSVSENTNTSYAQSFSGDCNLVGVVTLSIGDNKTCTITNTYIPVAPKLPNTGIAPLENSIPWNIIAVLSGIFVLSVFLSVNKRKQFN